MKTACCREVHTGLWPADTSQCAQPSADTTASGRCGRGLSRLQSIPGDDRVDDDQHRHGQSSSRSGAPVPRYSRTWSVR